MSATEFDGTAIERKPFLRPATVLTALVSVVVFLLLARHVVDAGYLRKDIAALQAGDAWRTGGWMTQIVLRVVSTIGDTHMQQTVLSLISSVIAGLAFGVLYERMRAHGWLAVGAVLVLLAVGAHAGTLYTLTAQSRGIPLYVAFAVLIPAIRNLEDVGDVQSAIGLGLLLPLLLLASPTSTLLILPLAVAASLAEPDSRRDPRAFIAMMLVTILPTLIVAVGILGYLAQAGFDVADALLPYVNTYSHFGSGDWSQLGPTLLALTSFAPVMAVPIVYCFWPDLPERRHVVSALAIVGIGLYLTLIRLVLLPAMTPIVPPLAVIGAFVMWLTVVRLPMPLRVFALAMLALSAVLSWALPGLWEDPEWKAALLHVTTAPLGNFALRPGV